MSFLNNVLLLNTSGGSDRFWTSGDMLEYIMADTDFFGSALETVLSSVVGFCMGFVVLFFLFRAVYSIYKGSVIERKADFFDYQLLIEGAVIIFALSIYQNGIVYLDEFITDSATSLSSNFESTWKSDNQEAIYKTYLEKNQTKLGLTKEDLTGLKSSASGDERENEKQLREVLEKKARTKSSQNENSMWMNIRLWLANIGTHMVTYIIMSISILIKIIVVMMVVGLNAFLIVIGPLAFTTSLIPMWRNKWKEWLGTFVTVKCTIITLIIMDYVTYAITESKSVSSAYSIEFGGDTDNNAIFQLGIMLTFALLYLMSFWLTSRWIGDEDSGTIISYGIAKVTSLAALGSGKLVSFATRFKGGTPKGGGVADSISDSDIS